MARKRARACRAKINFIQDDIRSFSIGRKFDAAICMYTSLGYFKRDEDNILALKNAARTLKPGGKFFLDLANLWKIFTHIVKNDSGRKSGRPSTKGRAMMLSNGIELFLKEEFDPVSSHWYIIREWKEKGKWHKNFICRIRLYSFAELKRALLFKIYLLFCSER